MRWAYVAAVVLAACVPDEDAGADCGADSLQHLVGQPVGEFDSDSVSGPLRIIPPGTAVTMDHRPDRLNIETDADGIVTRVRCG